MEAKDVIQLYMVCLGKKLDDCSTAISFLWTTNGSEKYFYSVLALYELLLPSLQKNIPDPLEERAKKIIEANQTKSISHNNLNALQKSRLYKDNVTDIYFEVAHPIKKKIMNVLEINNLLIRIKNIGKDGDF